MRRAWPVVFVLALAGLAGTAQAQSGGGQVVLFGVGGGKVVSQASIPARAEGEVIVSFRGDAAAGCAADGVCAYAGTIIVRPQGGDLNVVTYRRRGRTGHSATLFLGGPNGYTTSARVQRSAPGGQGGTCVDAQGSLIGASPTVVVHGGRVTIRLLAPGETLLQTRCAGPLDGDLAAVSPAVSVSLSRLARGQMALDLSGTRTFAAHGFTGTISSTLVLKLGKPSPQSSGGPSFPPGIKTQRTRTVTERLSQVRVQGGLSAAVSGTADPIVCRLLDTCGLTGTLTLSPAAHGLSGEVFATGPASRPYRDFLTALGLTRGGRSRGIAVSVFVTLKGQVRTAVSQAGGMCTDTGGSGGAFAAIGVSGRFPAQAGFLSSWRTRCPGPLLSNASAGLTASVQPGALAHRQFTIQLRGSGPFADDGYVVTPDGALSAVVRRGHITSQVITEPVP